MGAGNGECASGGMEVQAGECAGRQGSVRASRRVCEHAGKRVCVLASKCEYVRAGVRAGRGWVDRQGSIRTGNGVCYLARRRVGRQGMVRAGNGVYERGNGGAGREVCVRACRQGGFYLSDQIMCIVRTKVTCNIF